MKRAQNLVEGILIIALVALGCLGFVSHFDLNKLAGYVIGAPIGSTTRTSTSTVTEKTNQDLLNLSYEGKSISYYLDEAQATMAELTSNKQMTRSEYDALLNNLVGSLWNASFNMRINGKDSGSQFDNVEEVRNNIININMLNSTLGGRHLYGPSDQGCIDFLLSNGAVAESKYGGTYYTSSAPYDQQRIASLLNTNVNIDSLRSSLSGNTTKTVTNTTKARTITIGSMTK